jgi:hypothetical protein
MDKTCRNGKSCNSAVLSISSLTMFFHLTDVIIYSPNIRFIQECRLGHPPALTIAVFLLPMLDYICC